MVIYSLPNGEYPKPRDLGLKDFYHDEEGRYVGCPEFIPLEYKGREGQYYRDRNGHDENYVCPDPPSRESQEYQLENETGADNLSYGRNKQAERCHSNKEYEAWLSNWN